MVVRQVAPVYPPAARQAGTSGLVRLGVIITKEGRIRDITVVSSAGMQLDAAAMEAVKQWMYQPTLLNGAPVEVATTVDVNFTAAGK
jgi:periplasmic protein TonB